MRETYPCPLWPERAPGLTGDSIFSALNLFAVLALSVGGLPNGSPSRTDGEVPPIFGWMRKNIPSPQAAWRCSRPAPCLLKREELRATLSGVDLKEGGEGFFLFLADMRLHPESARAPAPKLSRLWRLPSMFFRAHPRQVRAFAFLRTQPPKVQNISATVILALGALLSSSFSHQEQEGKTCRDSLRLGSLTSLTAAYRISLKSLSFP